MLKLICFWREFRHKTLFFVPLRRGHINHSLVSERCSLTEGDGTLRDRQYPISLGSYNNSSADIYSRFTSHQVRDVALMLDQ